MTEPIIKEITVNASIAKVWKAISTKEDLAKWFHSSGDFELKTGHTFHMDVQHEGKDYKHTLTITDIVPEQKLGLDWFINGDPGITHVEYELASEGSMTKVKVTHSGFDKYGEAGAETRKGYNGGWDHVLNKLLKEYVEN